MALQVIGPPCFSLGDPGAGRPARAPRRVPQGAGPVRPSHRAGGLAARHQPWAMSAENTGVGAGDNRAWETTCLSVASFPEDLQPLLNEIDDEGNGKLELDELTEIFTVYAELKKANKEGSIAIKTLPKEIQSTLKVFDVDGDGTVAPLELARGAELYKESKKTTKRLMVFSGVLMLILCALVGVIVGLTAVVVEGSKETKTDASGLTLAKGTDKPAAMATVLEQSVLNYNASDDALDAARNVKVVLDNGGLASYTITGWTRSTTLLTLFSARGDTIEFAALDNGKMVVRSSDGTVLGNQNTPAGRRLLFHGALMTSGSFTMMAQGAGADR